jgi:hypothetical protein
MGIFLRQAEALEIDPVAGGGIADRKDRDRAHCLNLTAALVPEACARDDDPGAFALLPKTACLPGEPPVQERRACLERALAEGPSQ